MFKKIMLLRQKNVPASILILILSIFGVASQVSPVYADSLSYKLACQDGSSNLTATKQPAKHQVAIRCKSDAKFTYINNTSTAKSEVTGKCPDGEHVGSNVDVPNGESSVLTLYCSTGTVEHVTRTTSLPTVRTAEISPPSSEDTTTTGDCGGVGTTIIKCDNDTNGVWGILLLIISILTAGVGIIAVAGIVFAAILWATAEDKDAQIVKAKSMLLNIVIGIIAFALLWSSLQFLVPGGVFDRSYNVPGPVSDVDKKSGGSDSDEKDKKAYIRIGVYNAKSVDESSASQLSRFKVGWSRIKDQTDIVVIAEFSTVDYEYVSKFSNWSAYYPLNAQGDRGRGILYRNDKYSASNSGSVAIPLINTSGNNTQVYEPTLTLTRKSDEASVSIMAVHLAAINGNPSRWKTNQKNQQPIIGRWIDNNKAGTRIAAGDFNWYLPGNSSNLTGVDTKLKGERAMRLMIPKKQNFGDHYKVISGQGVSDHPQIIAEVETIGKGSKSSDDSNPENNNDVTAADINILNFRDASATSSGTVLKQDVLYRSASLSGISDAKAEKLSKLLGDNATIIDLRASERDSKPDVRVKGASNVNVPIGGIFDTSPMVSDPTRRSQLAKALTIAANAKGTVLIHCAAGKDRTGWMVAMIMYANGANDAQVMKEYLKSNDDITDGVKAAWLKSGLGEARNKYGSIRNYLKAIGLTDGDLQKLKHKFGA